MAIDEGPDYERSVVAGDATGAFFLPRYITRESEMVAVDRHDITELLQFDGTEFAAAAAGQFFFAGGAWLLAERWFSSSFAWDALSAMCVVATVAGVVLFLFGLKLRLIKRSKIERLFRQPSGR